MKAIAVAGCAAKWKRNANKATQQKKRLEGLERQFVEEVTGSEDYRCNVKKQIDTLAAALPKIQQFQPFEFQGWFGPLAWEFGQAILVSCFSMTGSVKDKAVILEAENAKLSERLSDLQKRSLMEVTALREKLRNFTPEQELQLTDVEFYDPLEYLPDGYRTLCKDIVRESVRKLFARGLANPAEIRKILREENITDGVSGDSSDLAEQNETLQREGERLREKMAAMEGEMESLQNKFREMQQQKGKEGADLRELREQLDKLRPQTQVVNAGGSPRFRAQFVVPGTEDSPLESVLRGDGPYYGPGRDTREAAESDLKHLKEIAASVPSGQLPAALASAAQTLRQQSIQDARKASISVAPSQPEVRIEKDDRAEGLERELQALKKVVSERDEMLQTLADLKASAEEERDALLKQVADLKAQLNAQQTSSTPHEVVAIKPPIPVAELDFSPSRHLTPPVLMTNTDAERLALMERMENDMEAVKRELRAQLEQEMLERDAERKQNDVNTAELRAAVRSLESKLKEQGNLLENEQEALLEERRKSTIRRVSVQEENLQRELDKAAARLQAASEELERQRLEIQELKAKKGDTRPSSNSESEKLKIELKRTQGLMSQTETELQRVREENQRLLLQIEELHERLKLLKQEAIAAGIPEDKFDQLLQKSGLFDIATMGHKNVFDRLYDDAMARLQRQQDDALKRWNQGFEQYQRVCLAAMNVSKPQQPVVVRIPTIADATTDVRTAVVPGAHHPLVNGGEPKAPAARPTLEPAKIQQLEAIEALHSMGYVSSTNGKEQAVSKTREEGAFQPCHPVTVVRRLLTAGPCVDGPEDAPVPPQSTQGVQGAPRAPSAQPPAGIPPAAATLGGGFRLASDLSLPRAAAPRVKLAPLGDTGPDKHFPGSTFLTDDGESQAPSAGQRKRPRSASPPLRRDPPHPSMSSATKELPRLERQEPHSQSTGCLHTKVTRQQFHGVAEASSLRTAPESAPKPLQPVGQHGSRNGATASGSVRPTGMASSSSTAKLTSPPDWKQSRSTPSANQQVQSAVRLQGELANTLLHCPPHLGADLKASTPAVPVASVCATSPIKSFNPLGSTAPTLHPLNVELLDIERQAVTMGGRGRGGYPQAEAKRPPSGGTAIAGRGQASVTNAKAKSTQQPPRLTAPGLGDLLR